MMPSRKRCALAGSTSARLWVTSSSPSNPSVPLYGKSISDRLPSGGLKKNYSSLSTPTETQEETQSVNHQPTPSCQCQVRCSNLFNHVAIGYVDATGVAHVMVLGGDHLNNPGSKQQKMMFY